MGKTFNHKLSIVMVAYNEEKNIEKIIREYYNDVFIKTPKGSEFIIYNDGSKDKTSDIIKKLSKELNLRIIDCKQNTGYFKAAKTALGYAKNDYIFFSDSSGKHSAKDFWSLASKIKKYNFITGLRSKGKNTLYRRLLAIIHRLFVSILFFMPLYDYNTGFKLMKKEVLDSILKECHTLPVTFSTELVIRAYQKGFSITNSPVSFIHPGGKEKQFALRKLPKLIWKELVSYLKLKKELSK